MKGWGTCVKGEKRGTYSELKCVRVSDAGRKTGPQTQEHLYLRFGKGNVGCVTEHKPRGTEMQDIGVQGKLPKNEWHTFGQVIPIFLTCTNRESEETV